MGSLGRNGPTALSRWIGNRRKGVPPVVTAVRDEGLTYLPEMALVDLYERAREIEAQGIGGLFVEAGCALGGSALVIAAAKAPPRPFEIYDTFGMIPPPSEMDGEDVHERYEIIREGRSVGIEGSVYYGYQNDLLAQVTASFARHGLDPNANAVRFVQGRFEDTMRIHRRVALAHLDGDWYASTMTCLRQIAPRLVPGGVIVVDDYDAWSGCRRAVDEYFQKHSDRFRLERRTRLHIVRR